MSIDIILCNCIKIRCYNIIVMSYSNNLILCVHVYKLNVYVCVFVCPELVEEMEKVIGTRNLAPRCVLTLFRTRGDECGHKVSSNHAV